MSAKCKASPTWIWRITTNKVINRPVGDISPCMDKMFFPWAYWSWLKCAAYQFYPALHEICSWPLLTLNAYTKIYKNLFKIGQKTFNITYDQLLTYFFFFLCEKGNGLSKSQIAKQVFGQSHKGADSNIY